MERLSGTRYSYTKTRVAFMVPFVFLIPSVVIMLIIFMLSTRALLAEGFFSTLPTSTKLIAAVLVFFAVWISRDLWRTFTRTTSEEIWITDRDIVWIGRGRRVLLKAPHYEIEDLKYLGSDLEHSWIYDIVTSRGNIRFTRSLEHADELISRIEAYLVKNGRKSAVQSSEDVVVG